MRSKLVDFAPDESLIRKDQEVVTSALKALATLPDTPVRRVKAHQISSLMDAVVTTALPPARKPTEVETPPAGRTCVGLSEEATESFSGSWSEGALAKLSCLYRDCRHRPEEPNPHLVVNLGHIARPSLRGQVAVGLHMFSQETKDLEMRILATNPTTGVRAIEYRAPGSKKPKVSTFFPDHIRDPDALLAILGRGEIIRQDGERCLMRLPLETYHVELYLHSGFHVRSCFPVFYYAPFDAAASYQVTETIRLSADDVLKYGRMAQEDKANVAYRSRNTVIVDIAPYIDGCPVKKGIYIELVK